MTNGQRLRHGGCVLAALTIACAAPPATGGVAPAAAQTGNEQRPLAPPGLGTLRIDDITMSMRTGPLLIKVTPMAEAVIRLLAPDSYNRIHAMAESRAEGVAASTGGRHAELFMVTFFSYEADVAFQPEDLQISHQGRQLRPAAIIAVTSGWGRQLLAQQDQQIAVYAFEGTIDYEQPILMQYGMTSSDAWSQVIPRLEVERARVRAKAGGG